MPTTNLYFNNYQFSGEQNLIEDLIIESIRIYGMEVMYMPRTLVAEDKLFSEDTLSAFNDAYPIEMYIKNVEGFEGEGDFLSKFGLEIRDEMTFTVSRRRFDDQLTPNNSIINQRPFEGDLIYFPLNNKIFEVKFVEHEAIFYQMGSLQTYDLRCELWEYSNEQLDTGISEIDEIEDKFTQDVGIFGYTFEDGTNVLLENGSQLLNETITEIDDMDPLARNNYYDQQEDTLDFVDWSESNPFGDL